MNQRLHHRPKARLTAEIKDETILRARFHKLPKGCARVRITLIYRPADRRRRDAINLVPTLKAIEDGFVAYGLVPDDTPEFIDPVMPVIEPPEPGQRHGMVFARVEVLG